jgi:hypothetical protein
LLRDNELISILVSLASGHKPTLLFSERQYG